MVDSASNAVSNITSLDLSGVLKLNGVTVLTHQVETVDDATVNLSDLTTQFNLLLQHMRDAKILEGLGTSSSSSESSSSKSESSSTSSSSSQSAGYYCFECADQDCIAGDCKDAFNNPWFSGFYLTELNVTNTDACKLYVTLQSVTMGGLANVLVYKDAARTQLVASAYNATQYPVPQTITINEENGSGVSGTVIRSANTGFVTDQLMTIGCGEHSSSSSTYIRSSSSSSSTSSSSTAIRSSSSTEAKTSSSTEQESTSSVSGGDPVYYLWNGGTPSTDGIFYDTGVPLNGYNIFRREDKAFVLWADATGGAIINTIAGDISSGNYFRKAVMGGTFVGSYPAVGTWTGTPIVDAW